jgi:hypothetical protein
VDKSKRKRAEGLLITPEVVPLPGEVSRALSLQHIGIVREACKSIEAAIGFIDPWNETLVGRLHHICESLIRRAAALQVIASAFEGPLHSDPLRQLRVRMTRLVGDADRAFTGKGTRETPTGIRKECDAALMIARSHACKAERLSLRALDYTTSVRAHHLNAVLQSTIACCGALAEAMRIAGWVAESQALIRITADIRPGLLAPVEPAQAAV